MPYRLHRQVALHDFVRSRALECHFVDRLAQRGELIRIENVYVDVPNLLWRRFICDTRLCARIDRRNGSPRYSGSCCTDLLVEVTPSEQRRLQPLAKMYLERCPGGERQLVATARKVLDGEHVAVTRRHEPVLADHPSNRCALSFIAPQGRLLCAVNGMCHALGLPVSEYKPDACYAYPLHYVDFAPGKWFLTMMCRRNYRIMGGSREAACMPCIETPRADAPPAYVWLRGEIEHLWGKEFYRELEREAAKWGQEAGFKVQGAVGKVQRAHPLRSVSR